MAKNGIKGDGHRNGAVKDRTQIYNPKNQRWVKCDDNGKFMDQKSDKNKPFKGITKVK